MSKNKTQRSYRGKGRVLGGKQQRRTDTMGAASKCKRIDPNSEEFRAIAKRYQQQSQRTED